MKAFTMTSIHRTCLGLLAAATLGLCAGPAALAANIVVDVAGQPSVNLLGEAGNALLSVAVGANAAITSLEFAVDLEAFAPSLLSELTVSFGSTGGLDLLTLAPAALDGVSGTGHYTGSLDLTPLAMHVGGDGLLRIEFSDGYKDFGSQVAEGRWLAGTLTFGVSAAPVPEPGSAALVLLGLGGLGVAGWGGAAVRRPAAQHGSQRRSQRR